jgi:iron(III) transport system substrate-binding protein
MQAIKSAFHTFAAGSLFLAAGALPVFAQADDRLVVYNAQHDNLTRDWAAGFTKETGIKVTIRKGSDMDMANQLVLEGARTPADVFLTENSPAMQIVAGKGLLAKIDAATNALFRDLYRTGVFLCI